MSGIWIIEPTLLGGMTYTFKSFVWHLNSKIKNQIVRSAGFKNPWILILAGRIGLGPGLQYSTQFANGFYKYFWNCSLYTERVNRPISKIILGRRKICINIPSPHQVNTEIWTLALKFCD